MSIESLEENKAVVRRYIEAIDRRDRAAEADLTSPDLPQRPRPEGERRPSPFGDHRIEITDLIAEGDKVWAQLATRGTHAGEYHGVPATGKTWTNTGVAYLRVAGGKIVERSMLFDGLNILRQVGATITPPAAKD